MMLVVEVTFGVLRSKRVEFLDALPISAAGKILKRELRERYAR